MLGNGSNGGPLAAVEADFASYLDERKEILHESLTEVGRLVRSGTLEGVSLEDGKLKISRPKRTSRKGWTL